jgi:hypothetical protein
MNAETFKVASAKNDALKSMGQPVSSRSTVEIALIDVSIYVLQTILFFLSKGNELLAFL